MMDSNNEKGLIGLVFVGLLVAFEALVVCSIWNWHVVPVFHVRALTFGHAIGLCCLVTAIKYRAEESYSTTTRSFSASAWGFAHGVLLFAFLWFLAWLGLQVGTKG